MLSDKDIDKMMKVFATKDEVRSIVREEIQDEVQGMKVIVQKTYEAVKHLVSDKCRVYAKSGTGHSRVNDNLYAAHLCARYERGNRCSSR